jgi:hypothetical protein
VATSFDFIADFAVSAPYASGGGAVFIYMGGKLGPICVKKIVGYDFDPNLSGFGYSFSRPVDVDNNGFSGEVDGSTLSRLFLISQKTF